jgi:hypothetical protein
MPRVLGIEPLGDALSFASASVWPICGAEDGRTFSHQKSNCGGRICFVSRAAWHVRFLSSEQLNPFMI